jgi:UDP-glucose 4-epimerase
MKYYQNNLNSTISLLGCMEKYYVRKLVFSSSATVYGIPEQLPLTEEMPVSATNPYGQTKLMIEQILRDVHQADHSWRISLLRYFNPVGAHESGLIGEDPGDIPNNLMPYISQVAVGKRERLQIFGNDYPTKDGTGMRDYIHVTDLAKGHLAALEYLDRKADFSVFNLGCGKAYSVLEMVHAFEAACGRPIPYVIGPRRSGDVAVCYADPQKAGALLGWKAEKTLEDMCRDTWNWQRKNPEGYGASKNSKE